VVDVRCIRELARLVRYMSCQRVSVVHAREGLSERRRLDDALSRKLLVGRGYDGEARGGLVATRHPGRLGGKLRPILVPWTVALGRLLLEPRFDDMALLFPDRHAPLQLLLHDGILGDKAR
jgi:hypothetical protein